MPNTLSSSFSKTIQVAPYCPESFFSCQTIEIPTDLTEKERKSLYESLAEGVKGDVMRQVEMRLKEVEESRAPF